MCPSRSLTYLTGPAVSVYMFPLDFALNLLAEHFTGNTQFAEFKSVEVGFSMHLCSGELFDGVCVCVLVE